MLKNGIIFSSQILMFILINFLFIYLKYLKSEFLLIILNISDFLNLMNFSQEHCGIDHEILCYFNLSLSVIPLLISFVQIYMSILKYKKV
jgi:hypothetical protein